MTTESSTHHRRTDIIIVLSLVLLALSIVVRFFLPWWDYASGDYNGFIRPWCDYIRENGYWNALSDPFHNYNPPYIYMLVLLVKSGIPQLAGVKCLSLPFEYLCFAFVGLMVAACLKPRRDATALGLLTAATCAFLPTPPLNSIWWSQCDAIYTSFALGSVYSLISSRPKTAIIFFAVALSFKLQAIFVFPLFYIYWLGHRFKFKYLAIGVAVYVLLMLPMILLGRPVRDVFLTYLAQGYSLTDVDYNFANWYLIFINWDTGIESKHFILLSFATAIVVLALGWWIVKVKKLTLDFTNSVYLTFYFLMLCPYLLPGMHDRYLFLADIFGIAFLFTHKRLWFYGITPVIISLPLYLIYMTDYELLPFLKIGDIQAPGLIKLVIGPLYFAVVALMTLHLRHLRSNKTA